jgi:four helix bundle protein
MRKKIVSFRDLEAWQLGINLVAAIYRASDTFPSSERYGLTSQMRRAAVSIPSNVAEGQARRSDGAFLNHVKISLGSQAELLTLLEVALRLDLLDQQLAKVLVAQVDEVRRVLHGLRRTLEPGAAVLTSVTAILLFLSSAWLSS